MNRSGRRKLKRSARADGSPKVNLRTLTREQAHERIQKLEEQIQRITDRLPNYEEEQPERAARARTFRSDLERDVATLRRRYP